MKKMLLSFSLVLAVLLNGCNQPRIVASSVSALLTEAPEAESRSEAFYPYGEGERTNACKWLWGGTVLAVPNKKTVRYLNLDNELVGEAKLADDAGDTISLYDNRILALGTYKTAYNSDSMQVRYINGQYVLGNGSFYDEAGKLLRELPVFEAITTTDIEQQKAITCESVRWIDEDLLVLNCSAALLFTYRISTDKVTLIEDKVDFLNNVIEKYGKNIFFGGGISDVCVSGKFIYYRLNENIDNPNEFAGKLYRADETGAVQLIDDNDYSGFYVFNDTLLMYNMLFGEDPNDETIIVIASKNGEAATELFRLDGGGYSIDSNLNDGFIVFINGTTFYIVDLVTLEVTKFTPNVPNCSQYYLVNLARGAKGPKVIYEAFIEGELTYYLFDNAAKTSEAVLIKPLILQGKTFADNGRCYAEWNSNTQSRDSFDANQIRVGILNR